MLVLLIFLTSLSAYSDDSGVPCSQGDAVNMRSVEETCLKATAENFQNSPPATAVISRGTSDDPLLAYFLAMSPLQADRRKGIRYPKEKLAHVLIQQLEPGAADLYAYLLKAANSPGFYPQWHQNQYGQWLDQLLTPETKNIEEMKLVGSYKCGADSQCRHAFIW